MPVTTTTMHNGTTTPAPAHEKIDVTKLPVLAWIIVAGVLAVVIFSNVTLVRYYTDRHETELFPFIVTVLQLSLAMFAVLLVPLDIYLADAAPANGHIIEIVYYILYGCIMFCTFVLVPFAYFYYEEDDEDVTVRQRMLGGCKYTSFLVVILIVLIVIGALLKGDKPHNLPFQPQDKANASKWLGAIFTDQPLTFVVTFGIASLTLLGFLCVITYTAYGMAAMPIDMMRGTKSAEEEEANIYSNLNVTREKRRAINAKYLSGKKVSKRDEKTLSLLSRQERVLARKGERIEDSQRGCSRVLAVLRPFAFVFGAIFLLFSLLLFVSLTLTQIVRLSTKSSLCGAACGYVINTPYLDNPLDYILQHLARWQAFVDVGVFAAVIAYLFVVTLSGVAKIGIRVLWLTLFKLKRRSSPPQGLMLAAVILVLALLAINNILMALAPQYTAFGGQSYLDKNTGDRVPCSLTQLGPGNLCHLSQIATLSTRINLSMPFFGVVFFWASWVFLATTLLSVFVAVVRCRRSNIDSHDSDSDETE